jgi:hypothetical protein
MTPRALTATAFIFTAGTISAAACLAFLHLLRRSPWSARYAAALLCLLGGTGGLTSVFMAFQIGLHSYAIREVRLPLAFFLAGLVGAGAIYEFLSIAGVLMLPLALPLAFALAGLLARRPRCARTPASILRNGNGAPDGPTLQPPRNGGDLVG